MEKTEKIVQKIENGEVKVQGVRMQKKAEKAKTTTVQPEGEAHQANDAKAGTNASDEVKAPKSEKEKKPKDPKVPKEPKVAAFPFKATINPYGFIGLGKDELRALGLKVSDEKGAKRKMAKEVSITVSAWNPETKELTIKVS